MCTMHICHYWRPIFLDWGVELVDEGFKALIVNKTFNALLRLNSDRKNHSKKESWKILQFHFHRYQHQNYKYFVQFTWPAIKKARTFCFSFCSVERINFSQLNTSMLPSKYPIFPAKRIWKSVIVKNSFTWMWSIKGLYCLIQIKQHKDILFIRSFSWYQLLKLQKCNSSKIISKMMIIIK